jgi:hypothetical protein
VDARIEGVQWDPAVVVVPTEPEPGDPRFGWLTYQGRWGQQAPSVNNGPTGPIAKTQWDEPVAWQLAEGRADAVALPPVPGPAPAAFCSLTTSGSLLFLSVLDRPWATALAVLAVVGLIAWSVIATTWTGSDPGTLDRERAAGQLVVAAFGAWRRRIGVFAVLGGLFLVGRFAAGVVRSWAFGAQQGGSITDTAGRTDGLADIASRSVTVLLLLPLVCFLATAAMAAVHRQTPTVGLREALRRAVAPSSAFIVVLLSLLALAVVSVTLVLLPLGAVLLAIWAVAAPAAMLEGRPPGAALRRSAELTKGRRLRTLGIAAAILLGAAGTAPVVGALLLLLTSWPFVVVDTLVAVLAAVLVPVAGVALMLLAYDLRRRFEREHLGEAVAAVR